MKLINKFKLSVLALAATVLAFSGCENPDEDSSAYSVLTEETLLDFVGQGAEPQTTWVYADGDWVMDAPEVDWIKVTPSSGSGNTEITISVADNLVDGVLNRPRSTEVYFRGRLKDVVGKIAINQGGDRYLGSRELTVTGLIDLEDGEPAKILESTVMAVSSKGFVLSDGTSAIFVEGKADIKAGDHVTINGNKQTYAGFPSFILDECSVLSSSSAEYPEPVNITSNADEALPGFKSPVFIKVDGSNVNGTMRIADQTSRVAVADPTKDQAEALDKVNLHKTSFTGYYIGVVSKVPSIVLVAVEGDGGIDESIIPYPVKWSIGAGAKAAGVLNYTTESFAATNQIESIQGLGIISYEPACEPVKDANGEPVIGPDGEPLMQPVMNGNNKFGRDVSGDNPRITGTWPGDYWLFTGTGAIKAGSKVRIVFQSRVSATNHKFWQLEYKDGDNWKIAGDYETTDEPGESITYTHKMESDGSTNITVDRTVKFNHNNDRCQFRFRCMANWQANGSGKLSARNGGTGRLAVTDVTEAGVEFWPTISIVEEGDGVDRPDTDPVIANIVPSPDYLAFEGTPEGPLTLTVTSDYDFTVVANADWISIDKAEGAANESVEILVTCEPSTMSTLRQSSITIYSADGKKNVPVIQSAAGQDLNPFVSIDKNKAEVSYRETQIVVPVQATHPYTVTSDVPWITIAPQSKTLVEMTQEIVIVAENEDKTASRTGHVVFAIEDKGVETVLTVVQAAAPQKDPNVIFEDDFEWLRPMITEYNALGLSTGHIGDFIYGDYPDVTSRASANAPNAYTADVFKDKFPDALAAAGYTDLNPGAKVIYPQDAYLKFCKGKNQTGLMFSPFAQLGTATEATLSFDWASHFGGSGSVDQVKLVVLIEGDGTFDNGTKVSDPLSNNQQDGEHYFTNASVAMHGVSTSTKVAIVPEVCVSSGSADFKVSGYYRYYLDNIKVTKTEVLFKDDFSWLKSMIDSYNASNATPIGNSVTGYSDTDFAGASSANAPNIYTTEPFKSEFPSAFEAKGYEDMNASAKVIYPQDAYLKFGKTSAHTSLKIKSVNLTENADINLEFDWCRHVQGSAKVDPVTLTVVITGDGQFENGKKYSEPLSTDQPYEEGVSAKMGWTHANVKILGAGPDTAINIVYTDCYDPSTGSYNWKVSGAHRYHLDNILITK